MPDIFKSYLSEEERAVAIEESKYEIQMAKLNAMYEMVDKNLELDMLEAEAKVLTESGTYDDLDYLYEEVNKEATEKKEGIIGKIVNAVKSIWEAITNTITNFLSKNKDVEGEAEVDANDEKRMDALNAVWGKIKQLLNFVKNNGGKITIGVAALGAVILGGLELFGKKSGKVKVPSSVVKGWIQNIKSKAGEVTSALASAIGDDEERKKALEILSTVGNRLKVWVVTLTTALGQVMVLNKVVSSAEKAKKSAKKNKKSEGKEDDKNETDSHVGNDSGKNKRKKLKNKTKKSVSQESYEEEIDGETVLESTDTIFGYDLSNENEIQVNEVYESVMDEIDDLLEDL